MKKINILLCLLMTACSHSYNDNEAIKKAFAESNQPATIVETKQSPRMKPVEEKKYMAASLANLKDSLNDADSAKFRGVFVHGVFTCGEINSKNAFGGYAGWQLFIASPQGSAVLDNPIDQRPSSLDYWESTRGSIYKKSCIN